MIDKHQEREPRSDQCDHFRMSVELALRDDQHHAQKHQNTQHQCRSNNLHRANRRLKL